MYTVGHGTLPADDFVTLVSTAGIERIVDVRSIPKSRHNPQYAREAIEGWLSRCGIAYEWSPELGGFRRAHGPSPNTTLRHASFRNYADYMLTEAFGEARDALLETARDARSAIMCSESLWWRCHRRLIADNVVLVTGVPVVHLLHSGKREEHRLTQGARKVDRVVLYDCP